MKKPFYYIPLCIVTLFFGSCESDFVPFHENTPKGGFVRFEEELNFLFDLTTDPNPAFEATLVAPSDNVVDYKLEFTLVKATESLGPFDLFETTSLPTMLSFDAQELASIGGIPFDKFKGRLDFEAEVTREDGTIFTSNDFTGDLNNPGQRNAMSFSISLICPSSLAGTFDVLHIPIRSPGRAAAPARKPHSGPPSPGPRSVQGSIPLPTVLSGFPQIAGPMTRLPESPSGMPVTLLR